MGRSLAGQLAAAALLLASVGAAPPERAATPNVAPSPAGEPENVSGACRPTTVTERTDVGPPGFPAYSTPVRLVIGGALAGRPLDHGRGQPTSMTPGDYWFLRDAEARPWITLRAERLDAPAAPTTFRAVGSPLGRGFPAEWSPYDWYYRTGVEALETLPTKGCWRISLVGGAADDAIVYRLKKVDIPGPR